MSYYIGFDVGTGSARAALLKEDGTLVAEAVYETITFRDSSDHSIYEQSLTDIWSSICKASNDVLQASGVKKEAVKGVGFDATCSLAVTDFEGRPVSVQKGENLGLVAEGDVGTDHSMILWADHRAELEANEINASGSSVLDYVGGTMSRSYFESMGFPPGWKMGINNDLEMEIPKTLWLKKHMKPERFAQCMFFDLPDYLTYRATTSPARSSCSLVCKFSYVPPDATTPPGDGWNEEFLTKVGLEDVVESKLTQVGGQPANGGLILTAGLPVGKGLSEKAAQELGLCAGTAVGSGVIDAYAGWIGTAAARSAPENDPHALETIKKQSAPSLSDSRHRLAAVAGTSTCYIVQSPEGHFVSGVWGPYKNAVFPGWWMNEGGQSSTGQLIDFVIKTHPAYPLLVEQSKSQKKNMFDILGDLLESMRVERKCETLSHLTRDLHIYPDLHGNRSPLADNRMRGMMTGLALDSTLNDLALKFNATLEAICLQARHILEEMNAKGHEINSIYMSGGQVKNKRLMSLLSSICRVPVILPPSSSAAVVSGSAFLGRFAAEVAESRKGKPILTQKDAEEAGKNMKERLWNIMVEMTPAAKHVVPGAGAKEMKLLDVKYKIFRESIDIQKKWRKDIQDVAGTEGME